MAKKVVFEAVQPVVDGNEVVVAAGDQFASLDEVPEGVLVREVVADVPDAPEPKLTAVKPAGKAAAK